MRIWCYKCDFDPIEEWAQIEGSSESNDDKDYKEHLEKLYEFLWEWIDQKLKEANSNSSHNGKSTLGSSRIKNSLSNGVNSRCMYFDL